MGLTAAIRLKTTLLHELATRPSAKWPEDIDRFIAAVESCDLEDATALVVLLADLKEAIQVLTGRQAADEPVRERRPALLMSDASSKEEILAQFRLEVAGWLRTPAPHRAIVSPIVERLTHLIDENYAERLTLDVLAAAVGRSKRYVATLFRQQTGQTVHRYLTQVRVDHAAALIRQREKIEAVSLLVGYRGKKNFYQHFKQQIGVTPGVYKTALMGLAPPSVREPAKRQPKG
jgi:AraC-like DNA-binding protein